MRQNITRRILAAIAAAAFVAPSHAGPPLLGTSFSYQGELRQNGAAINGTVDLQFSLFAAAAGGVALDGPYFVFNVPVVDGKFTVSVSHSIQHFTGAERYLGIAVRSPAGAGAYTTLAPRQRISPTPYALQTRGIFVNSSGNAGIGAASPAARLHVDDGADASLAGGGYLVVGDTIGLNVAIDSNEIMARNNAAAADLAINAGSGNVGVGTLAPEDKLHVIGGTDAALAGGGYLVLGATNSTNLTLDNNEIMARNNGGISNLGLNVAGGDVNLVQNGGGNVGIGTNSADARLHVVGGSDASPGSGGQVVIGSTTAANIAMDNNEIMARNNGGTSTLFLNAQGGTVAVGDSAFVNLEVTGNIIGGAAVTGEAALMIATNSHAGVFGRNNSDGALVFFFRDGNTVGSITVGGGVVSYNAFTGSHYGCIDEAQPAIDRGTLMTMTGCNRRAGHDTNSEIIYGIAPSSRANDPACLGTYLGIEETTAPAGDDNPHLVMAVGNGEMWVIDTGSDLAPGDLLISSDVAGCAMKDDPRRFVTGHIIARTTQRVDWNEVETGDDGGVKRALISVLFDSFTRSGGDSSDAIEDLRRENAELRAAIERIERQLENQ